MKKSLFVLFASAALGFGATLATAADVPSEATVLKVTGSVQVQLPGQAGPVALNVGDKIPQGATIITGAGAEAYIQPFTGTVSTITENSTVEIEKLTQTMSGGQVTRANTLLNLKSGNLVSTLDPAKRSLNNYGVRTPKGVAAARGTSYSVQVSEGGFSISATADNVTFTTPTGQTYSISAGMISIGGAAPIPLATAVATHPEVAGVVQTAVTTVAAVVQNNLGGISAESASNLVAQVVGVATTAVPTQASAFTSQAVAAVNAPGSTTAGNAAVATAAVTAAAVSAVTNTGGTAAQVAAVATAATTAAPAQATTVAAAAATAAPQAAAEVAAAVVQVAGTSSAGAVTAAVQQVAPQAASQVVQAVATATGQTTEQVQQAATTAAPTVAPATQAAAQGNTTVQTVVTPVDTSVVSPH